MRSPQVIVTSPDDWMAHQLADLVREHRWLIQTVRKPEAAIPWTRELRPTLLLVQVDPTQTSSVSGLQLVRDVHRTNSDVPCVLVCDVKLPEESRIEWTMAAFDLGARFVLFPPLTKPTLEDLVSGLMLTTIRRTQGGGNLDG